MELNQLNNIWSTCLNLLFTRGNLLILTYIYNKTTTHASHKVEGPISWYFSIEHDKTNNCCSTCPKKLVTSKKLRYGNRPISKYNRPSRGAIRPAGLFFLYHTIELDKLNNFCSTCIYKQFTSKKVLKSTHIDNKSTQQASH